jgi:uncharacterized protein YjbJ (UPF0337 family)
MSEETTGAEANGAADNAKDAAGEALENAKEFAGDAVENVKELVA